MKKTWNLIFVVNIIIHYKINFFYLAVSIFPSGAGSGAVVSRAAQSPPARRLRFHIIIFHSWARTKERKRAPHGCMACFCVLLWGRRTTDDDVSPPPPLLCRHRRCWYRPQSLALYYCRKCSSQGSCCSRGVHCLSHPPHRSWETTTDKKGRNARNFIFHFILNCMIAKRNSENLALRFSIQQLIDSQKIILNIAKCSDVD